MAYFAPYIDSTGIHIPSFTDIQDYLISSAKSIFGQDIYLDSDSQDMQWIASNALAINDVFQSLQLAYNNQSPQSAIGTSLDSLVKLNGIQRLAATYSTVQITCIGTSGLDVTIPAGVVQDTAGYKWDLPESSVIPAAGVLSCTATCEVPGNIVCDIGAIQTIVTPQYGWDSVSNAAAAYPGTAVETDTALRLRQSNSVMLPSQTPLDGTIAAILAVTGVTRQKVYENYTKETDSNGIPANTVAAVVEGGTDSDIASAIAKSKTMGCGTYGTTAIALPTQYSVGGSIYFSRPTESTITVIVTLVQLTSGYTKAVQDSIVSNIQEYLNTLDIGASVQASSLYYPSLTAMASQTSPSFRITSIVINKTGTNTATVTTQTSGSTSLIVSSVSGITVGMTIIGAGIPNGTIVTAIDSGTSTLTLSQAATITESSGTVTFYSNIASIAWNEVSKAGAVTILGGL